MNAKRKPGRPSLYTPELADEICRRYAEGAPISRICLDEGMPARSKIYEWAEKHEEFRDNLARARLHHADAIVDGNEQIEDGTMLGQIEPNAARVVLASRQWRASKFSPAYSDKVDLRHSGSVNFSINIHLTKHDE
jgi:hypothetical protein